MCAKSVKRKSPKSKLGKKELCQLIEDVVERLAHALSGKEDHFELIVELCEILDGKPYDKIQREVGEMSSNQWCNYLELSLKGIKGIH